MTVLIVAALIAYAGLVAGFSLRRPGERVAGSAHEPVDLLAPGVGGGRGAGPPGGSGRSSRLLRRRPAGSGTGGAVQGRSSRFVRRGRAGTGPAGTAPGGQIPVRSSRLVPWVPAGTLTGGAAGGPRVVAVAADAVVFVAGQWLLADAGLLAVAVLTPALMGGIAAREAGLDPALRVTAAATALMAAVQGFGPGPEPTWRTVAAVIGAGLVAAWAALTAEGTHRAEEALADERRSLEALKEQVVTTVSHELRTPLTIIQGLTSTLVSRWDALPETRRLDLIDSLGVNVASLDASVLHFLDAGRLAKGGWEVRPRIVKVAPLLDQVLVKLAPVVAGHDVQRRIEDQEVWADPEALGRMLELLLVNACRFSPPAGPISVRVAGSRVTGWEVSVADRGQGINPDDLGKVFDRLWRADVGETGVSRGAGLGLAIVKELAERHGGTAAAASRKGRGSTFRIHLPPPPPGSAAD